MRALGLAVSLLTFAAGPAAAAAELKPLEQALDKAARTLAPKLAGKVAVLDLSEAGNDSFTSEFGQTASELLSAGLVGAAKGRYQVLDRRELLKLMRDSTLFGSDAGLLERLQKNAGMDVSVGGSYSRGGTELSLRLKAVSVKTGEVLASASAAVPLAGGLERMAARRFRELGVPEPAEAGPPPALELEAGVFYEGGDGRLYPVRDGMVLNSKDNYAVYVKPAQDCHLYVYQVDETAQAVRLFPNPAFRTAENPLKAGAEAWLPNAREFFFLDEHPGREELVVLAVRKPSPELERLETLALPELEERIKTMGAGGARASQTFQKVKGGKGGTAELLTRRLAAQGDFVYRLSFIHQ